MPGLLRWLAVAPALFASIGQLGAQAPSIDTLLADEASPWLGSGDGHPDLGRASLIALVIGDSGSTMRSGPHRDDLKAAILPAHGAKDVLPHRMRDRAVIAFALAETQLQADYKLLLGDVRTALASLLDAELRDAETQPAITVAWGAFALRSARDGRITGIDEKAIVAALSKLLEREIDPSRADLGRLALELALPDLIETQAHPLAVALRLQARNEEELALASLTLALRASDPMWLPALQRIAVRRDRITPSDRPEDQRTALELIAQNAFALRSRIIRLDVPLNLHVLDADGRPAEGFVSLPTSFWRAQMLIDGRATFLHSPLGGMTVTWSPSDPTLARQDDPGRRSLGELGQPPQSGGTEITLHLPR